MTAHRILLYSHDGYGLGHLRRNLNLATRLVREMPGSSALLVAGFAGVPGVDLPEGVDIVKLPSIRKVATETWQPRSLRIDDARMRDMRRALVSATVRTFAPDLVVVDFLPGGAWGELIPSLETLRAAGKARLVLGLRDILDAPDVTRAAWARAGHGSVLSRLYDRVLIYGQQDVFDGDAAYGLSEHLPGRIQHVGYLCAGPTGTDTAEIRARLGAGASDPLVVVSAGGGADAFPMMDLSVRALRELAHRRPLSALVVAGPLMRNEEFHDLENIAAGTPIRVRRTMSDLPDVLGTADLVITMGAYNTLAESLRLGRRVLAIPRRGPSAEQQIRTRLFAERGLIDVVPDDASPASVAELIGSQLDRPAAPRAALDFGGLDRATGILTGLLDGEGSSHARRRAGATRAAVHGHRR